MTDNEAKFIQLKDRYTTAYQKCNNREVDVFYKDGFVHVGNSFGGQPSKHRVNFFKVMTHTLENRALDIEKDNKSLIFWRGLDTLAKDNLNKKYFPFFNYSELEPHNIREIYLGETEKQSNNNTIDVLKKLVVAAQGAVDLLQNSNIVGAYLNEAIRDANKVLETTK